MRNKTELNPDKTEPERRTAFKQIFRRFGVAVVGTLAGHAMLRSRPAISAEIIRPPGALPEPAFDSTCIRCGLCVEDCPYDILKLASWTDDAPVGTPFFVAREDPCRMCADIPCARACPTGALDPLLTDIRKADMGVAVLVGHETCLNYKGMSCSICWRVCPIRDEAITLETIKNAKGTLQIPTVHSDRCTGCGTCEKHCVLSETAIRVLPRKLGLGQPGRNSAGRDKV
ncbi:MAG: ferredoxin-type protein NapG [Alteromonadaceae bacterium]|jgi:ferredoxin-type protein NapG|uniref:ferredoxin-type protein NapG n=1 Tax=unclassified Methylophaga TaxID=2629249 RepID=UPI000C5ECDF9|nr:MULTISPECIES: ferredoxin-type protein NapG [unclassified Methylophaga]MAP28065.1 ferredoxin-type protein NapG [Methylophaga sp.]MBN26799.1 ferredoxin-type protein NapG [Alteromonadaceae bacterium]HBX59799.1 ferredoxin-type protein NapG [Methylophaga sp.]|tara:strand:- start:2007 stop:2693 length:687 start_codon:yes stop_codon:yes gene_type:complete